MRDENNNKIGVILFFDDVTKEERLKKKNSDSALTFTVLITLLSIWIFACAIYMNDENPINTSLFGIIYRKQKSIWGLCIPHFVLGTMLEILGFTAT